MGLNDGPNAYLAQMADYARQMHEAAEQARIERQREWERYRGIKIVRLPVIVAQGANPFLVTADQSQALGGPQGPDQGFVWSLQELTIEGLTRTATPDIVQVTRQGRVIWELNGNQYAQTWGKGAKILFGGEYLGYQSVGTFNSTAKIVIHGAAWQVPAEEIGKLL